MDDAMLAHQQRPCPSILSQTLNHRLHGTEMRPQHPHTEHTTH